MMLISIHKKARSILAAGFMARSPNQHHFIPPLVTFVNATVGSLKTPLEICQHEPAGCVRVVVEGQSAPVHAWNSFKVHVGTFLLGVCTLLVLLLVTTVTTRHMFKRASSIRGRASSGPSHSVHCTFSMPYDLAGFRPRTFYFGQCASYGWKAPLGIRAGPLKFTVITNPEHIRAIFRSSKHLTSKPAAIFSLKNLLNAPPAAIRFYEADDSGMGVYPRKGSKTRQEDRMHFHQAHTAQKYLAGQHLSFISEKYCNILERNLGGLQSINTDEWTAVPDLYGFLQQHVFRSAVETLMGSKILELNPNLNEDFWTFDRGVLFFLRCLPRWLIPKAYRARDRLLAGIKKWHAYAQGHSDCSKLGPDDPEWDQYFGTKLIRARQDYPHPVGMQPMSADVRASEDMGLMFAANANILPCILWYIFEALKDPKLMERLSAEVSSCVSDVAAIDVGKLSDQPLLQSAYAEILRLRVAIAMSRVSEHDDFNLSGYRIPKDHPMIIFSRTPALNEGAWASTGRTQRKSLEEFDAERFLLTELVEGSLQTRFSLNGLAGLWLPYGGGQRMCPGRHFAKNEILVTFAILFSQYEMELAEGFDVTGVQPDMRWYPVGALPPKGKVPISIKRRTVTKTQIETRI